MKLLLLVLVVLIAGCATPVTKPNIPGIERSDSVQVTDLRPASEKKGELFSMLVTSDAYGTYRIEEAALAPPAIRLLQHRAFERFDATGGPLEIKVHHLVIYRNLQTSLRRTAIRAGVGGAIGAIAAGPLTSAPNGITNSMVDSQAFDALATTEYKRAFYAEQENPGHGNVFVIYMDIEMQGNRTFTRTIAPLTNTDALTTAVEAAIQFQLAQYN
jgi:hypothetical protein